MSSPPSGLKAGDRFTVTGKVRNTGGTSSPATVALELRAGSSPKVVSPLGGDTIAKVRPGTTRTFRARVTVGRTVRLKSRDATSYLLAACVRPRRGSSAVSCRKASGRSSVAAPPAEVVPAPAPPATPAPTPATPSPTTPTTPAPDPTVFTSGARTLGDTLFPTIGNGGYDAQHYDLDLRYTVASKFLRGTVTMTAVATQDLSDFSLDLTETNDVASVTVDGAPASFALDPVDDKLVVTPPAGLHEGSTFRVAVAYGGIQTPFIDPDGSSEGWIPDADLGATAVGEPVGAMGWFPNNNVPFDKATYTTRMTVPSDFSVLGTGVLKSKEATGTADAPTSTFVWDDTDPTASYLYSVSIGRFTLNSPDPAAPVLTSPAAGGLNTPVPFYTAIDGSFIPASKAAIQAKLDRTPSILDYYADYYGVQYPFSAAGGVVPLVDVGYSLETQGKPTYATTTDTTSTGVGISTVAHENGHMYFGDGVTLTQWKDIWLNEGMTEFTSWLWQANVENGTTLAARYASNYTNSRSTTYWRIAPANPPTAADIFNTNAMYNRGATTMLSIHDILGEQRFKDMMHRWLTENMYGNVTTERFIALVKETDPTRAARWTEFFRQWLYTSYTGTPANGNKPSINVGNFDTFVLP
ncbi:M1 family metallopeptidase [Patulibacter minatonensis]|uniref:M1 family metallopeptidase n=1 Tax=Patulibacter minatonensis TaxID=298163 RepID=UPI00146FADE1|nr:M1 family metallopeptidase [Patulibacter minatonensis]